MRDGRWWALIVASIATSCVASRAGAPAPQVAAAQPTAPADQTGTLGGFVPEPPATTPLGKAQLRQRVPPAFRLRLCTEAPVHLEGPPGEAQSRGCVGTFRQRDVERRFLIYAPANLPARPTPVVLVFPGRSSSAEAVAFYTTHTRFEALADRDGFVVIYGNGLPDPESGRALTKVPKGGFLSGCLTPHDGEGVDVAYVRELLRRVSAEIRIDWTRIYATGMSAGGGMSFELALEAPDLVAAVAPEVPLPFVPAGPWRLGCHPKPGHERISIAMLAATDDPFISYAPGGSREYPQARYPGMEQARDAWVAALGLAGPPEIDELPDRVPGDSYQPDTGRASSQSSDSAMVPARTDASSGSTRRSEWGTPGRARSPHGAAFGRAWVRTIKTSISRTRLGPSFSGTPNARGAAGARARGDPAATGR